MPMSFFRHTADRINLGFDLVSLFAHGEQGVIYDCAVLTSMFQESAGTTPAAVDSPVGKLNDLSGNANHALQATAGKRPLLKHDTPSGFYLEFDGTDDFLKADFAIAQPFTRISLIDQRTWVADKAVFGRDVAGNSGGALYQHSGASQLFLYSGSVAAGAANLGTEIPGVVVEVHNGALSKITINQDDYGTGDPGSTAPTGIWIGAQSNGAETNIRLYGVVMINRVLTTTEIEDVTAWLTSAWQRVVVIDGDSNSQAQGRGYSWYFIPNANPVMFLQNIAKSGTGFDTSAGDLVFRTASIDARIPANKRGRQYIYFPWWSNNAINPTAANFAARVATFLRERKAAGWDRVGIGTIVERTDVGQDNTAVRGPYNTIIRDPAWLAANGIDFVVDFAAEPHIGVDGASTDPTVFNDPVHLSAQGHIYAETVFRATINTLVGLFLFVALASSAIAAEPDPRLAQIQQQRQETMNQMVWAQQVINAVGILEQGQIKLRELNEEERKIKSETKIEAKPKGE